MKDPEFDGNIIQFLNGSHSFNGYWFGYKPLGEGEFWWRNHLDDYHDEHKKLIELMETANKMLNCLMTEQEIKLWQDWRSWGKISPWREQALAQIELFKKQYESLKKQSND